MHLNFRNLALASGIICFALSVTWLLAPNFLLGMWGVEYTYAVGLVSRRCASLFLALAVIFALARNATPSPSRSALVTGFVVGCLSLAALGVYEFLSGHANISILFAVVVEISLALAFLVVTESESKRGNLNT
jgi:hypothetical protein